MDASREDLSLIESAVLSVLSDIGASEKKVYLVLNKADLLTEEKRAVMGDFLNRKNVFLISTRTGEGMDRLLRSIGSDLAASSLVSTFFFSPNQYNLIDLAYKEGQVLDRKDEAGGTRLKIRLSPKIDAILRRKLQNGT